MAGRCRCSPSSRASKLVKAALWLLIIVVFAQAILSWTAPDGPFAGVLNALTFRFLAPIRRWIPPLGGTLDLSPLILIVDGPAAADAPRAVARGDGRDAAPLMTPRAQPEFAGAARFVPFGNGIA